MFESNHPLFDLVKTAGIFQTTSKALSIENTPCLGSSIVNINPNQIQTTHWIILRNLSKTHFIEERKVVKLILLALMN